MPTYSYRREDTGEIEELCCKSVEKNEMELTDEDGRKYILMGNIKCYRVLKEDN